MSTINFNLQNKNQFQIKSEILNKMSKIRQNYSIDSNYHDLFFNIVQQSTNNSNMKLSINKQGGYSLKLIGGNEENQKNSNPTAEGNLTTQIMNGIKTASETLIGKNEESSDEPKSSDPISSLGETIFGSNKEEESKDVEEPEEKQVKSDDGEGTEEITTEKEQVEPEDKEEVVPKDVEETSGAEEVTSGAEEVTSGAEEVTSGSEEVTSGAEEVKSGSEEVTHEDEQAPKDVQVSPTDEKVTEEKKPRGFFSSFFKGGDISDSEYDSDILSVDDDFIPYTTAIFDEQHEEDMMDHIRNMKSKKYLKSLHNNELREIMKKNNMKITNGGSYLSKDEMVKSIKKFYK